MQFQPNPYQLQSIFSYRKWKSRQFFSSFRVGRIVLLNEQKKQTEFIRKNVSEMVEKLHKIINSKFPRKIE